MGPGTMRRRLRWWAGGLVWAVVWGWNLGAAGAETVRHGNPVWQVRIGTAAVAAEVVESGARIFQGLSGREDLPEGTGMLFVMPVREVQHFCMRGMRVGLDFIWIDGDRVIGITPGIAPGDRRTLSSPGPATHVLEVPAGFSGRQGLRRGARVRYGHD